MPGRITHGSRSTFAPGAAPVAVIDIGSNSVRLVVYEGAARIPFPIYNEKVLCGLGRGLDETRRLSPEGVELAIANLQRFMALTGAMGAGQVVAIATAAVREAVDGAAFVARVEAECGVAVDVLTGEEEARLSGLGVIAAFYRPEGVAADLGGGSLELVDVTGGAVGPLATLPIGPIRLREGDLADRAKGQSVIDAALEPLGWLSASQGKTLYLVGGAWRALGRFHMIHTRYPLWVTHHYVIPAAAAHDFAGFVARLSQKTLLQVQDLSRRRLEVLPFAAAVLQRLIERSGVATVAFSAYGLREGTLVDRFGFRNSDPDPLIAACRAVAELNGRIAVDGDALFHWMSAAFPDERADDLRFRRAACLLSDLEWSEHPDYRTEHALLRILRYPLVGIDHRGRAFIAVAVSSRHGRVPDRVAKRFIAPLLGQEDFARARGLGLAMRLAYSTTGGVIRLLEETCLRRKGQHLELVIPEADKALVGDVVRRRLAALAHHAGCEGRVVFANAGLANA